MYTIIERQSWRARSQHIPTYWGLVMAYRISSKDYKPFTMLPVLRVIKIWKYTPGQSVRNVRIICYCCCRYNEKPMWGGVRGRLTQERISNSSYCICYKYTASIVFFLLLSNVSSFHYWFSLSRMAYLLHINSEIVFFCFISNNSPCPIKVFHFLIRFPHQVSATSQNQTLKTY